MSNKHLRRVPQYLWDEGDYCWYYEEDNGICVVVESDPKKLTQTVKIPWRRIRNALARKDKP